MIRRAAPAAGVALGAAVLLAFARGPRAGAVTGQLTILERPGERTTDLENAVVYLEPARGARAREERQPLDQRLPDPDSLHSQIAMQGRQFVPRVRVVPAGSWVDFPNQDSFSHNIFSSASGASFDLGLYGKGKSRPAKFRKAGTFPIFCNIHARMTAYVVALNSPHYAQPAADGRFSIAGVPPGRYTVHFWHERAPEQTREITVGPSGATSLDAQLDARGYKWVAHKNKFGQEYSSAGGERY
ncbi:MAG TPA: carboxypeptidase regulatory-like domain-containing protein [Gemmatimonadaceae bacterium]|nr:carboxypeptidase regulatory-like domain-containing protein [Gemmatimonadaceae bacterium]